MPYVRCKIMPFCLAHLLAVVCAVGAILDKMPESLKTRGGLGVLIGGSGDIAAAVALSQTGPWRLHLLHDDSETVHAMRETLQQAGHYGRITAEVWSDDHLPYADNLVNFIFLHHGTLNFERQALLRVLAPERHRLDGRAR